MNYKLSILTLIGDFCDRNRARFMEKSKISLVTHQIGLHYENSMFLYSICQYELKYATLNIYANFQGPVEFPEKCPKRKKIQ